MVKIRVRFRLGLGLETIFVNCGRAAVSLLKLFSILKSQRRKCNDCTPVKNGRGRLTRSKIVHLLCTEHKT